MLITLAASLFSLLIFTSGNLLKFLRKKNLGELTLTMMEVHLIKHLIKHIPPPPKLA